MKQRYSKFLFAAAMWVGCASEPRVSDDVDSAPFESVEEQAVGDSRFDDLVYFNFPSHNFPNNHFLSGVANIEVADSNAPFRPRENIVMRVNLKDDAKAVNNRIAPITVELYRREATGYRVIARQLFVDDVRSNSFTQYSTRLAVFTTRFTNASGQVLGDFEFSFSTEQSSDYPDFVHIVGTGRGLFSLERGEYSVVLRRQYEPERGNEQGQTVVRFENFTR